MDGDSVSPVTYVRAAIDSFQADPPVTEFQKGYLAALRTVYKEAFNRSLPHRFPYSDPT